MLRIRHRISGYVTIAVLATVAALAAVTLGLSSAQAHTTTATLLPDGQGTHTAWSGNENDVDDTGTPDCDPQNQTIFESTSNDRESVVINLADVPNGATITSVDVLAWHRGDTTTGGTFQTFARLGGVDTDSGTNIATTSTAAACTGPTTQTINVTDTVKAAGTVLEIGVVKTAANTAAVRVGALRATVTYNRAPNAPTLSTPANAATTTDRTPDFDWTDATDPDTGDALTYEIGRSPFVSGSCVLGSETINSVSASSFTPSTNMAIGTHCWRVRTVDHGGLASPFTSTRTLTIQATNVTAVITAADKEYDGDTDAEYTCDVVGEQSGDDVTCDGVHPATFDTASAGTGKTVTATGLTLSGTDAGGYNLTNTTDTDTADITKVTLSVEANNASKDYGDDDPIFLYSLSGFVNGENEMTAAGLTGTASCTRDAGENVAGSPFEITCAPGTLSATNYDFVTGDPGELTINQATLAIDADDQTKVYGDTDPDLTYTLSGFKNGEDETSAGVTGDAACDRESGQSVAGSPYTITCEPGTLAAANYDFETGDTGELTIEAADVSAEITADDKVYDGTTDAEYTCEVSGEQSGDTVSCDGTHPATFDDASVGTDKTVTANDLVLSGAEAGNYNLTNTSDTDEADITKATLLVNADDATKDYGDDEPTFTYTLSGFADGDDEMTAAGLDGTASCTRDAGETVAGSPYEITCAPGTLVADNYDFDTGATGDLNIEKADPNCTIDGFTGTYDGDLHSATGTCEGVDGEGPLDGLDLGDSFTDVPGGTATWTFTDEAGNYDDDSGTAEIVIDAATLTVDADDKSKNFGELDPPFTYTLGGFADGEDETSAGVTGDASCTRFPGETVAGSPYIITCEPGSLTAANYDFVTGETGELTIDGADVSAEITAADKVYDGTTDAEYTCEVVGAQSGDDVTCDGDDPASFDDANAGADKTVTATNLFLSGGDAGNYTLTNNEDTDLADITKATLSVDAEDDSKDYGEDDPTFLYSLSGFVNGEDETSAAGLTGAGECTRDAGETVAGSPYTITCTEGTLAADNYAFETGETGELTINQATLSIDADDQTKDFGDDDPTLTYTLSGFANGEDETSAGVTGDAACDREPGETVAGSPYIITCEPGSLTAANYDFVTGETGELTIEGAEVSAEITAADKVYDGTTDAEYTCEVVGAQSGDDVTCDGDDPASFDDANAGADKTVTATNLFLSGDDAGNYTLTNNEDTDLADITKATLSVDAEDDSKDYGEDDPTFLYSLSGFVNGEDETSAAGLTGAGECTRDAGETVAGSPYTITCTEGTLAADNYAFETGETGELTINQATLSIDADDQTKDFGDDDPTLTYTLSGFANGEDETSAGVTGDAACDREPGETVAGSPYIITCEPGSLTAANYDFVTGETGELTIEGAEVSAEITAADKPYDGLVDAVYTCDVVGEASEDDVTCDGDHPATFDDANAGTDKTVTATNIVLSGDDAGNYTLTNNEDTDLADITKATLSVDAEDQSKSFGDDDPTLTYTLSGFIAPDDASNVAITGAGECTRDPGETVAGSPYTITCTPGDLEADNYDFVAGETGELTINPDTSIPSVTINQAETQDDPTSDSPIVFDVVFSEDVTGFEGNDVDLSGSAGATTADVTGDGAEYTVSVSGMASSGTVIAAVKAAAATDGSNDSTASTSDDDTVEYVAPVTEFDPGPTATISGTPRVGDTLTAGEGSPSPTPDSYEYEWFADGSSIAGATNQTFTPTDAQVGKAITVKVTAVKAGFTSASDLSDPTAPVGTLGPKTLLVRAQPVAHAGDRITIRVARLAPREAYTLTFEGEVIKTGMANAGGTVSITFLLPLSTQPGSYEVTAVGSLPDRTGTDTQLVRAPSSLGVTLTKPSVPAGGTQRVQVNDLLHGERRRDPV